MPRMLFMEEMDICSTISVSVLKWQRVKDVMAAETEMIEVIMFHCDFSSFVTGFVHCLQLIKPGGRFDDRARGRGGGRRTDFGVVVTNLPKSCSWQDLKDFMRKAGDVVYTDVDNRGEGIVEYSNKDDMENAVEKLDDTEFKNSFGATLIRVKYANGDSSSGKRADSRDRGRGDEKARGRSPSKSRSRSRDRGGAGHRSSSRDRDYSDRDDDRKRGASPARDGKKHFYILFAFMCALKWFVVFSD